jgi:hypothetical protein
LIYVVVVYAEQRLPESQFAPQMLDAKLTQPIPGTIIIKIGTNVGVSGSAGNGHWDDLVAISALWTNPWQAGIKHG